jgi:tetratricopeptide (TPR) repeat protein
MLVPVLVFAVLISAAIAVFFLVLNKPQSAHNSIIGSGKKQKSRETIVKEAGRRLEKNPRDPEALSVMGDLYYNGQEWDKAYKTYQLLSEMPSGTKGVDEFLVHQHAGLSAVKLGLHDDAYKYFLVARTFKPDNYEAAYQLGNIEYLRGNYEKAVTYLQSAKSLRMDYAPTLCTLGHAHFKLKQFKEAMTNIRKALEISPGDKEALFTLAECYYDSGQNDQAQRIYTHLRPDAVWGPKACLQSGLIKLATHQTDAAIADFELGLKHLTINPDVKLELQYQLGNVYLTKQDIATAMSYLHEVQSVDETYKDIQELLKKYEELSANKNLQIYTLGSSSEFISLCRKIVMTYYAKARVKITKATTEGSDWSDILAEINTPKWSDIVMFRFIRIQGTIGEIVVRDFHTHLKEVKAGKGICFSIGQYSEEARHYIEARLIELIEKSTVISILRDLDNRTKMLVDKPT